MDYLNKSITELHELIVKGIITPEFLVKSAIEKAKSDTNNAFEYICEKEALKKVKNLDKSLINSPFFGIPVVIKDNFSTKDIPTTASSDMLANYVPIFSSEVVLRLEAQGAIIIGKTTLDELAMGGTGTTGHKGTTYNPWDPEHKRMIGGSSCGSAAAISAGIVPLAIGSDTGDSVRKPASYSCLVGFKPTWSRISRFGLFPFATSLDHVAFFTRNVKDAAITLNVLAGHDEKDASSSFEEVKDYTSKLSHSIKGKKIAVVKEIIDAIEDKDIIEVFNQTLSSLKKEGAIINYVSVDRLLLRAIYPTYMIISSAEATSNNACLDGIKYGKRIEGKTFQEMLINTRSAGFSERIKRRFVIGSFSLLKENTDELFLRAQKCRRLIVNAFNKILETNDAIYCPASPTTAPLFEASCNPDSDNFLIGENYLAFANMGGLPSITIPIGFKEGLPFGGNLTSKIFSEDELLSLASSLEKICEYKDHIAGDNK